jgi:hypothetical protein
MRVAGSWTIARDTGAWKMILQEATVLQRPQCHWRRCSSLVSPTPGKSQRTTGYPHKNSHRCTRRKVVLFTLLLSTSDKNHSDKCVCKYVSAVSARTSNERDTIEALKINVIFEFYVRFRLCECDIHNCLPRKSHGKPNHRNIRCGCLELTKETFPFSGL